MNIRNNLRFNLHLAQEILQVSLPGVSLWLDPKPGPDGMADVIIRHPGGRVIRCHCDKDGKTDLTAESIAAAMVRCMRERNWPMGI
jgi:hypothetical protein